MLTTSLQKQEQLSSPSKRKEGLFFQPKLTINQPNDMYEQEADVVADKVMRTPEAPVSVNADNKTFFSPPTVKQAKPVSTTEEPLKKENKEEESEESLPEIKPVLSFDALQPPDDNKTNNEQSIQRKCNNCEEEEKKKLQRKEADSNEAVADSSTENFISSLNGKGQSLTQQERKFFEPRMGYDFSLVQLHINEEAAESAKNINALAYTHDNNIVFGANQYQPNTNEGKRLIAHELTHVVQQNNSRVLRQVIQRMDLSPLIPNYSQVGDTCGAASVVAALTIWHNEHRTESSPNSVIATTCNIILSYMIHHRSVILSRIRATRTITDPAEDFYNTLQTELTNIRNRAINGSREILQTDFQHLGLYLAFIFNSDGLGGMSASEIEDLLNTLHLAGSEHRYSTLPEILDSSEINGLGIDSAAQVNWFAGTPASFTGHAFIIGRLNNGNWYLYDQGQTPPFRIQEASYVELRTNFTQAMQQGRSWILSVYPPGAPMLIPSPWTGVRLINRPGALLRGDQHLILPGDFLAEVDEGATTIGQRLQCMGFVGAEYDLNRAKTVFRDYSRAHATDNYSGLIIEMPRGVWSVYVTNTVSDANLNVRSIDVADSAGGKLATNIYYHAYLLLCSTNACQADFFTVY